MVQQHLREGQKQKQLVVRGPHKLAGGHTVCQYTHKPPPGLIHISFNSQLNLVILIYKQPSVKGTLFAIIV